MASERRGEDALGVRLVRSSHNSSTTGARLLPIFASLPGNDLLAHAPVIVPFWVGLTSCFLPHYVILWEKVASNGGLARINGRLGT